MIVNHLSIHYEKDCKMSIAEQTNVAESPGSPIKRAVCFWKLSRTLCRTVSKVRAVFKAEAYLPLVFGVKTTESYLVNLVSLRQFLLHSQCSPVVPVVKARKERNTITQDESFRITIMKPWGEGSSLALNTRAYLASV